MMMLAFKLQTKGDDVTVYDCSANIGGAWSWFLEYKKKFNKHIPRYSNAIVPLNKKEERFIKSMNKALKDDFKISIKKTNKKILTNYKFKKKYIYNFNKFYITAKKSLSFSKKFIFHIKELPNRKILLNKSKIFDTVFFPSYAGVRVVNIRSKNYKISCREIVSEHLSIIAKKFKLKNFYYSDFYDDLFDRVKIDSQKAFYSLTARLAFKIKKQNLLSLKKYIDRFVDKKNIINIKKSKFRNFYRNKKELVLLSKILNKTNINYVDTTQFVCGFYFLRNFFFNKKNL